MIRRAIRRHLARSARHAAARHRLCDAVPVGALGRDRAHRGADAGLARGARLAARRAQRRGARRRGRIALCRLFDRPGAAWCMRSKSSEPAGPMLKEIWRVLAGGGRLLIVAPNRRGIWARLDRTPFGSGRPYTMSQLSHLLREELFTPVGDRHRAVRPAGRATAWSCARPRPGSGSASAGSRRFAGVVLIEATKQIYAKPARRPRAAPPARLRPGDPRAVAPRIGRAANRRAQPAGPPPRGQRRPARPADWRGCRAGRARRAGRAGRG